MAENQGKFVIQLFIDAIPNIISGLKTIILPNIPYFLMALLIYIAAKYLFKTYTNRRRG